MEYIIGLGLVVLAIAIIFVVVYKKKVIEKQIELLTNLEDEIEKSKIKAKEILDTAEKNASSKMKEMEIKAKEKAYQIKEEAEKEIKNIKAELAQKEAKLDKKEETLDSKIEKIEIKSIELEKIGEELDNQREEIEILKQKEEEELSRISGLSKNDAKDILIAKVRDELTHETAVAIKEFEKN